MILECCSCSGKTLLERGCVCGYFKQCKRDADLLKQAELDAARARQAKVAEFLTGPMPGGVMIAPDECASPKCNHPSADHMNAWGSACAVVGCPCMRWTRKPDVVLG